MSLNQSPLNSQSISINREAPGNPPSISVLKQNMLVPNITNPTLHFTVWAASSKPEYQQGTQTISLRTSTGSLLYTQSHNISSPAPMYFLYVIPESQVGKVITLETSTYINGNDMAAPSEVSIYIDDVIINTIITGPEDGRGGW
jgi:hypothetical protein